MHRYYYASQVLSRIFQESFEDILNKIDASGYYIPNNKTINANYFYGKEFDKASSSHDWLGYNNGYYLIRGAVEIVTTNNTYGDIYAVIIDPDTWKVFSPLYIKTELNGRITVRLDNSQIPSEY